MSYIGDGDGVFEIREYLDDNGSIRDRTVIDITKELEFMRKVHHQQQQQKQQQQKQQHHHSIEAKDNYNNGDIDMDNDEDNDNIDYSNELNDDEQFIRELSILSNENINPIVHSMDMIDSMDDLSIAAVPSRSSHVSLANNSLISTAPTSSSASSSSISTAEKKKKTNKVGWSKGFLNSTAHRKLKSANKVDITSNDSRRSSIIIQETSSDTTKLLQSIDNNTNDSYYPSSITEKTSDVVVDESEVIVEPPKKNLAFTGHIFERMTP